VTYTSIGGFQDSDKAILTEIIWKNFQEAPLYIDPDARVGAQYFYDHQMFGPSQTLWYDASVNQQFSFCCRKVGLVINRDKLQALEAFAFENHATVKRLAALDSGRTEIVSVIMDGTKRDDSFPETGQASVLSRNPRDVVVRGLTYQWITLPADIQIESDQARSCVIVRAFSAPQSRSRRNLHIQMPDGSGGNVDLAGTNTINPREIRIPLESGGKFQIHFAGERPSATQEDRRPSNYFIVLPVKVTRAEACSINRVDHIK
jgi:hypothetical protein